MVAFICEFYPHMSRSYFSNSKCSIETKSITKCELEKSFITSIWYKTAAAMTTNPQKLINIFKINFLFFFKCFKCLWNELTFDFCVQNN